MAIFDFVVTFIFVFILHFYMWQNSNIQDKKKRTYIQYILSLLLLYVTFIGIGVMLHYIMGIKSGLSFYLGFNDKPDVNR